MNTPHTWAESPIHEEIRKMNDTPTYAMLADMRDRALFAERELAAVTEQRDRLAEALQKVVTSWNHAEWLDENDFDSFRDALQSLTPNEL